MSQAKQPEKIIMVGDCHATVIPSGLPILLVEGTEVMIIQSLGGAYTVQVNGKWVRIAADDAGCLGSDYVQANIEDSWDDTMTLEQKVWSLLKTCYDPEIPVDIVELGLIYHVNMVAIDETENMRAHVVMTLTAPGCGMGPVLIEDIKQKLHRLPDIKDVVVELVFDPPWTQDRMSDAAKLQLGMF